MIPNVDAPVTVQEYIEAHNKVCSDIEKILITLRCRAEYVGALETQFAMYPQKVKAGFPLHDLLEDQGEAVDAADRAVMRVLDEYAKMVLRMKGWPEPSASDTP